MASSQTGDEHGVLGFSAGQLRQARGRRAPAGVVYLFSTATTTHSATPTPTHTRPVHALQRRHPAIPHASDVCKTDELDGRVDGVRAREQQRSERGCMHGGKT